MRDQMSFEALRAELARWTFLPGWSMTVAEPVRELSFSVGAAAMLRVRAMVPNSRDRAHPPIRIELCVPVPFFVDGPDAFATWLRGILHDAVLHEADEWLQRDGVLVFDPHAQRPAAVGGLPRVGPSER